MTYKGSYVALTDYAVGDAVLFTDGHIYHMVKDAGAGTPPTKTEYWSRIDQDLEEAINVNQGPVDSAVTRIGALESIATDKAIFLKSSTASSTKVFKITVVDNGTISAAEVT